MTSLRGGVPDGSGGWRISPDGSVMGSGGGSDWIVDKRERQCLIGGFNAARASAFDFSKGMRTAVLSGFRGVGSFRMYPMAGTVRQIGQTQHYRYRLLTTMLYGTRLDRPSLFIRSSPLIEHRPPNPIAISHDIHSDSFVRMKFFLATSHRGFRTLM